LVSTTSQGAERRVEDRHEDGDRHTSYPLLKITCLVVMMMERVHSIFSLTHEEANPIAASDKAFRG
jgi:hypothetical protein